MIPASSPLFHGRFPELTERLCDHVRDLRRDAGAEAWRNPAVHILLPSRGAASAIARGLLQRFPGGVAGLLMETPESLARSLLNQQGRHPRVASEAERRMAMKFAARNLGEDLLSAAGAEVMLERSYRDLRDHGMTIAEAEARGAARHAKLQPRQAMLFAAAKLYEEYLSRLQLTDPADLLEQAAALLISGAPLSPHILFGFYDLTGVQQRLIRAMHERRLLDSIYVPVPVEGGLPRPPYEFATPYVRFALSMSARETGASLPGRSTPIPSVHSFSSPHEEFRETCRAVRHLLDRGVVPHRIALVMRSIDRREAVLLERSATEFAFGLRRRAGIPLASQRIGRALIRLLRLGENDFPRSQVMEVLRDGIRLASPISPRQIDFLDRMTRRFHIAGGGSAAVASAIAGVALRDPDAARSLAPYLDLVREVEALSAGWHLPAQGRWWAETMRTVLDRLRPESEEDLASCETIDAMLELLAAADSLKAAFTPADIAEMIEGGGALERSGDGAPEVWFGDVMGLRGRTFDHVFLLAAQEDRFPQRRTPDPLLPDRLREMLSLPPIGDGRPEEELLFQLTSDAALEAIRISYSRSDGFGRTLRPSVFLRRFDRRPPEDGPRSSREQTLARLLEGDRSVGVTRAMIRRIRLLTESGGRSEWDGYITVDPTLADTIRERLSTTTPSYFEDFGDCPQKFLFKRLLHADEMEDPEHEPQISLRDKGGLDHAILERFYRETPTEWTDGFSPLEGLSDQARAFLGRLVDEEFDRMDAEFPPFNPAIRRMERDLTKSNLARFLTRDLEELSESGLRPSHFEYRFGTSRRGPSNHSDAIVLDLGTARIGFRGSIDRIDRSPGEESPMTRYRVVDYKSGTATAYSGLSDRIDAGHKLQLAIYAVAVEQMFGLRAAQVSGAIKPIRATGSDEKFRFELEDVRPLLMENLDLFVHAILSGRFPAFPGDDACRYCPLDHSCRTRHDPFERRLLRQHEHALDLLKEFDE